MESDHVGRFVAAASHSAKQLGKGFALRPDKKGGEQDDEHERWAEQAGAFGDEGVEGEDVYDDRAEHQKAEIPREGNRDEDAADQFQDLYEGDVSGWHERSHEEGDG